MRASELTKVVRPNKAKDLLEDGEFKTFFADDHGWNVLGDGATQLPDGRPISEFVAVNDNDAAKTKKKRTSSEEAKEERTSEAKEEGTSEAKEVKEVKGEGDADVEGVPDSDSAPC